MSSPASDRTIRIQEIDVQNRELLQILEDLRNRQEELAQLNRELEDTNRGVVALYAELDEKAEHLKQADRLKSTFLSHMSHEFRTPLNSIMALSKILHRPPGWTAHARAGRSRSRSFITRLGSLTEMVNDLLDLAKVEAGKIDAHICGIRSSHSSGNASRHDAAFEHEPERAAHLRGKRTPAAHDTDEAKVSQILRNFVSNAIKFTESGEIRVSSVYDETKRYDRLSPCPIRASALRPRNRIGFSSSITRSTAQAAEGERDRLGLGALKTTGGAARRLHPA